ncbi:unnamed protein product [Arabis nemorensis]|uniref:Uncharacterized protein n=1 Tax=Arabis nemorensis TaxID=586526 RepID=A0A565BER7_9BRAS|nr:unnamed protein product [Arabis nemorensis]
MKANNLSRRKFHVLGKKRKVKKAYISLSRSRAVDKTSNTLLQSFKSLGFMDKRVGEQNDEIGELVKEGEESTKKSKGEERPLIFHDLLLLKRGGKCVFHA